jgi:hypothetical protein
MGQAQPFTIEKFLGINRKTTETLLQPGEASSMVNWIVTDDMKLQKMYGYARLFASLGAHKVGGMWYGAISGVNYFIFACNGHVYRCSLETGANTDLGAVADAFPTMFFAVNNTLYVMDGTEMYAWNGSGSLAAVTGYTPTVFTAAPPAGGGAILEGINYLSGKKTQKFSANGTAVLFQLAEFNIGSVDAVYLNGALMTPGTDYSVNLTAGSVTFVSIPAAGTNNVSITWTKVTAGDRQLITNCRYYGGVYYARYWLFGNPNHKNTRYVSGVTMAGVSDPGYWPKFTDSDVGEYEITGICTQYSKQLVFTSGDSEAAAWFSNQETYTDPSTEILTTLFPVYPMNQKVGNVAKGQVRIIYNNPLTVWQGIYEWVSTNVIDEKNAQWISERIQLDLDGVDLTQAVTVDWSDKGLYWLCVGKKCWVLNYRVKAWYVLELKHAPTCFVVAESVLYFGTEDGYVMRFDELLRTYDGAAISAVWEMGYYNFGIDWIEKFLQRVFVTILPRTRTHVDLRYMTDKSGYSDVYTALYSLSTFEHANFAHWSFSTNYSPQPKKFKIRAKKIDYFKIILTNDGTDAATVLSITLPVRTGGEVRGR